ncbi:Fc.00g093090.m01.CDS01 [Cosmosporella sp. VM-42]
MPPRKTKKRGKQPRLPTQFGELDTTPTSRHFQSPQGNSQNLPPPQVSDNASATQAQQMGSADEFEEELEDIDLIGLDEIQAPQETSGHQELTAWSDAGSLTRRSSPILAGETPRDLWEFSGESPNLFTSPASGKDKLPDTMPLPLDAVPGPQVKSPVDAQERVDFSETATTARRSSPVGFEPSSTWDIKNTSSFNNTVLPETHTLPPLSPAPHFPIDDIYDATPPGTQTQKAPPTHMKTPDVSQGARPVAGDPTPPETLQKEVVFAKSARKAPKRSFGELLQSELGFEDEKPPPRRIKGPLQAGNNNHPKPAHLEGHVSPDRAPQPAPVEGPPQEYKEDQKSKKRKQRAKTPIQFDETTQKVTERPKPAAPVRMPIVSALRESVQPSSSPLIVTKKKAAPKTAQPKRLRKSAPLNPQHENQAMTSKPPLSSAPHTRSEASQQPPKPRPETNTREEAQPRERRAPSGDNIAFSSTQHIVLSSDGEESSYTPESPVYSPGVKPANTAVSNLLVGSHGGSDLRSPRVHSDRHSESPQDLEPPVMPFFAKNVSGIHQSELHHHFREVDSANPPNQLKSASQGQVQGGGPRQKQERSVALAPRDPNMQSKQGTTHKHDIRENMTGTTRRTRVVPAQPSTRSSKLTRHFSISEAGSPVLVESDQGPLVDHSVPHEYNSSELADKTTSRKLHYSSLKPRQREPLPSSEDPTLLGSDLHRGWKSSMPLAKANGKDTRNPVPTCRNEPVQRSQHFAPLPPQFANMNRDMHDRILAALQGQDTQSDRDGKQTQKKGKGHRDEGRADSGSRHSGNDMAVQLHGVVNMMMSHLQTKEKTVYQTAEAYRKKGLDCVTKIENKYNQERKVLAETSRKDSDQFVRGLQKARAAIGDNEQKRQVIANHVVESLAARRLLYQRATTSLRSLHRRLLEGKTLEGDM